jgi:adenylosuccinate synthase
MSTAHVVIGTGYGDEGKGSVVNRLASERSLVIRFNGGAQAGHTVEHSGRRHVCSHVGAGILKGAATHLSRFFVCNPWLFFNEMEELKSIRIPKITASPDCYISLPVDVEFNRMQEEKRGDNAHGSVGVGFGETLHRCEGMERYRLQMRDLVNHTLKKRLEDIAHHWMPRRSQQLGVPAVTCPVDHWYDRCMAFRGRVDVCTDAQAVRKPEFHAKQCDNIIFEGAQGLLLDQDYGGWPHVTRSNTGLKNVSKLYDGKVTVHYVSRAYTTRHGQGPLPFELDQAPYEGIVDETNLDTGWQGRFRFSYLNLDLIAGATAWDARWDHRFEDVEIVPEMTCLDQCPDKVSYIRDEQVHDCDRELLPELYANTLPATCRTR